MIMHNAWTSGFTVKTTDFGSSLFEAHFWIISKLFTVQTQVLTPEISQSLLVESGARRDNDQVARNRGPVLHGLLRFRATDDS